MRSVLIMLAITVGTSIYIGCSPVSFSKDPLVCPPSTQENGDSCVHLNGKLYFEESLKVGGGQVDVLFVDDNSGSMSFEQKNMANKFDSLLQELDNRKADYRLAITTTDVAGITGTEARTSTPSEVKDGGLLSFSGSKFLTSNSANILEQFQKGIQRDETLKCETWIRNNPNGGAGYSENCPSQYERGIFAANLVVQNNPGSFIRAKSHLAVVIISDEENNGGQSLSTNDLPDTLINNIKAKYPQKTFSAHAIITDTAQCKATQDNQMGGSVKGSIGNSYKDLAQKTGGVVGSVCATDYGRQLGEIGLEIADRISEVALKCSNPQELSVLFNNTNSVGYQMVGNVLKFDQILPAHSDVKVKYACSEDQL